MKLALALAAVVMLGLLFRQPFTVAQEPAAAPTWSNTYSVLTLQVGATYDFSLVPTAEICDSWTLRDPYGIADDVELATPPGRIQEQRYYPYGFSSYRSYRPDYSYLDMLGPRGPWLGISLSWRDGTPYVVGTPTQAGSPRIGIQIDRFCRYDDGSEDGSEKKLSALTLRFEGSTHNVGPLSVAHQHHHDLTQAVADARYAHIAHTHDRDPAYVPKATYDALVDSLGQWFCASAAGDGGAFWDAERRITARTIPWPDWDAPALFSWRSCCIPAESGRTAEQCWAEDAAAAESGESGD